MNKPAPGNNKRWPHGPKFAFTPRALCIRSIPLACLAVIALPVLLGNTLQAQPTCSINIGADDTICQGETALLQGPASFGNYLWSNGAVTPGISVTTAGDYWCQVSYPSGNLVANGDFSAGNTGFSSEFIYSLFSVQNEGYYTVGTNASWYHNQFQGTGNGNFLIANAGYGSWVNNQLDIWCQTIPCCPGQTYTLSFRARSLTSSLPARAVWMMDGVLAHWPDFTFPAFNAGWQQFTTTWTAAPGQTSMNACIRITSGDGVGDDFGLDDISIAGTIILRDTVHVEVTPLPVVNLGPDLNLCDGETADLDATVPGGTYLWQDGSTTATFHVATAGNYGVTVTAQNCSSPDQVNVSFQPLPMVQLGMDTVLCAGSVLNLSAAGPGYAYEWQDGSTASSFTVSAPGLYWVEVTHNNCAARDSIVVGYKPMPMISLGNDTAICAGASLLLDATVPGATYLWQDGSTAPTFSVATAGNYQVAVDLNGCIAQDGIQIAVSPLPLVDLGPDITLCPGAYASYDATTPGATYLWNDGSTGPTLATSVPGNYSVQVSENGCSASDTAAFANFDLQTVDLGPGRTICAGTTARIGVSVTGAAYTWSTGASTDSINVNATGTYWVDAFLNGCAVRDSIHVAVMPLPVVSLGPDLQVCPGEEETLNVATAGGTYLWNNGATGVAITVGAGTWAVDVTVNGCTASDSVVIAELAAPQVDLGPDTALCPGESILLDAGNAGMGHLWNTGATNPAITVNSPTAAWVVVTNASGCFTADTVIVSYASPGSISLGPDLSFCAGEAVTLNAAMPGAGAYLWNDGSTGATFTTGASGTYWVQVLQGSCTIGDTVHLQSVPAPSISIGNDTTLCAGETMDLSLPSAGLLLEWQDGSTGAAFHVNTAGSYWVAATNSTGCTDTAFIQVEYLLPGALDLGPDTMLCEGASLLLNAGLPGGTTQWSGSATAFTPTLTVSTAGTFIATTMVAGCSIVDTITISVNMPPVVSLGPDLDLCTGSTVQVSTSGTSLLWDDGSTDTARTISQGGLYWVRAEENGCTASDTLIVHEHPVPVVNLGPDTALCAATSLTLNAFFQGGTYLWNDGATVAQRQAGPGSWHVQVAAEGCTGSDTILIGLLPSPVINLPADTTLCAGETWTVDLTQPNSTYQWTTGGTSPSITIDAAGNFGVTIDREGCTATGGVQVEYVDLSSFTLGPDTMLCPGASMGLHVGIPYASVVWQDASTEPDRTVSSAGSYHATITVAGCSAQAGIQVGITALPMLDLGIDRTLCAGDTALLSVDPGQAQPAWSNGSTAPELQVTASGVYVATLTLDGCTASDTVQVLFKPMVNQLDLGPDRSVCRGMAIMLDATIPGAAYTWNNGSHEAVLAVTKPGTYSVAASGPCILAADTVTLYKGECAPDVYLPNAFTPDGDGINDLFIPLVDGKVLEWNLAIYDRWGERIHSDEKPEQGWDGKVLGQDAPMGVYVWDLHYRSVADTGVVQERLRGTVTLVR